MKEFFVGLLVLMSLLVLCIIAAFFLPFILLMSVFLQIVVYFLFFILAVWLIGRITLWAIAYVKK
jgi:hypothetical protein